MFLKKFTIKNFRCIKDLTLELNEGLNILVGENNSGKTAIIDALRLCLSYGNQFREIYVSLSDFHIDNQQLNAALPEIEFHAYFEVNDPKETGPFNEILAVNDQGKGELQLHFRYFAEERNGLKRIKYKVWGGEKEGQHIPPEVLDLFYFIYLGALRDAVQGLRPVRGNRLGELFQNLQTDEESQNQLTQRLHNALKEADEWQTLIKTGKQKVNEHLKEATIEGKLPEIKIDFLPFEFRKVVDNLRLQLPVYTDEQVEENEGEQQYFDLYQNGLGYNNLIYTAIVLGDLQRKKELERETYVALLIEEPEAHLHPQLQNTFFEYLNKLKSAGFQVFTTSHSPTITAKADLNSLIVLHTYENKIRSFSVKHSALSDDNKKYLQKFLDVTKSQLFFAKGVILVEGIAEALLLPIFSRMFGEEYSLEKRGVEIVNLNGVAFAHFGKLFNTSSDSKRLNCRCVILRLCWALLRQVAGASLAKGER